MRLRSCLFLSTVMTLGIPLLFIVSGCSSSAAISSDAGSSTEEESSGPTVTSTQDSGGDVIPSDTPVSVDTSFCCLFSEVVDPSTCTTNTLKLSCGSTDIVGTIDTTVDTDSIENNECCFVPGSSLPAQASCTFTCTNEIRDTDGNEGTTAEKTITTSCADSDDFSNAATTDSSTGCWAIMNPECASLSVSGGTLILDAEAITCSGGTGPSLIMSKQLSSTNATITLNIASWANVDDSVTSADQFGLTISSNSREPGFNPITLAYSSPDDERTCRTSSNSTAGVAGSECAVPATGSAGFCLRIVKTGEDIAFQHSADCLTYTTLQTSTGLITAESYQIAIVMNTDTADGDLQAVINSFTVE